jgi:hypothetical protein
VVPAVSDPMELLIAEALNHTGASYTTDYGAGNDARLDFYLVDYDVYIEVKRMHSPRIAEQMSRAPNVIVAQGEEAVKLLAYLIKVGDL